MGRGKDQPRKKDAAGKKRPSGKSAWLKYNQARKTAQAGAVASAPVSKRRRLIQHDIVKYNQARKTAQAGAVASAPVSKRRRLIQHDIVRVQRKKRTVATQTDGTLGCKECEVEIEPEITRKNDKGVDEDSSGYDGDIDDLSDGLVDALAPGLTRSRARVDALARSA
eukprot:s280_g33.t1